MDHSIKNTTREERKKMTKKALGISIASNEMPSKETIEIVKEYVDGRTELEEVQRKVIERYKEV